VIDRFIRPPLGPERYIEPGWARFLFASRAAAWLWLVVRLYVASVWIPSAWNKITGGAWLFGDGAPVAGLAGRAIEDPGTPTWYASFLESFVLPNASLFATLVPLGELAVGLGLLFGAFTGIAAFFGVFMNANFVLSGVLSSNPVLIVLQALLMVAWRNAGWIGLDRLILSWAQVRFSHVRPDEG
jgi:thiosulfate dehydrogenase [quinone] large subunit